MFSWFRQKSTRFFWSCQINKAASKPLWSTVTILNCLNMHSVVVETFISKLRRVKTWFYFTILLVSRELVIELTDVTLRLVTRRVHYITKCTTSWARLRWEKTLSTGPDVVQLVSGNCLIAMFALHLPLVAGFVCQIGICATNNKGNYRCHNLQCTQSLTVCIAHSLLMT